MTNNLMPRLGTFFILIGLALLILFVGSVLSKEANGLYLLISMASILIGLLLRRTRQANDSGRFRTIRQARARGLQRREDKMKKPEKK